MGAARRVPAPSSAPPVLGLSEGRGRADPRVGPSQLHQHHPYPPRGPRCARDGAFRRPPLPPPGPAQHPSADTSARGPQQARRAAGSPGAPVEVRPSPGWRGGRGKSGRGRGGGAGRGGHGYCPLRPRPVGKPRAGPGGQRPGRPRGRQSFTRRSRTVPGQPGPSSEGRKSPPVHTAGPCWLQTPVPSQTPAPGGGLTRGVHLAEQPPAFGVEGHARTPLELLGRLGGWKTRAVSALPRRRL